MLNDQLGISFSPFNQNVNGASQAGLNPSAAPQSAIQTLSLRTPRVVGASSPVPGALLNSPGSAAFGPAGMNLEQLLALLYGGQRRNLPGGGTFPERPPQGDLGLGGMFGWPQVGQSPTPSEIANAPGESFQPLPWMRSAPLPRTTFSKPPTGEEYAGPPPETLRGADGGPYVPPNFTPPIGSPNVPTSGPLPWERSWEQSAPTYQGPSRPGRGL